MPPRFKHTDLQIVEPEFSSSLTDTIIELDHLRRKKSGGTTHPKIFSQLKSIFHLLESIGSARIEGNNTTIAEVIETKLDRPAAIKESIREIENSEQAMDFIDKAIDKSTVISKAFVLELHKRTVAGLTTEGDRTPGQYRRNPVTIGGSSHLPPEHIQVDSYMEDLIDFINRQDSHKYDLLKTAIAHHRFVWIHPFNNGNGRVVRLLTYAMLIKHGFNVQKDRILNPTAIFCIDRDKYYTMLAQADAGSKAGTLIWCEYVLNGLLVEINKIDRLSDHRYLEHKILTPAIDYCRNRGTINDLESAILKVAIKKMEFQSGDIAHLMKGKIPAERSRVLAGMKKLRLIEPTTDRGRKYLISFANNYLLRGVIHALRQESFIALSE